MSLMRAGVSAVLSPLKEEITVCFCRAAYADCNSLYALSPVVGVYPFSSFQQGKQMFFHSASDVWGSPHLVQHFTGMATLPFVQQRLQRVL